MSNFITGREAVMAAKKGTTWRTAVEAGANDGLLILSERMGAKAPTYVPDDSLGQADIKYLTRTNEKMGGGLEGYLRFRGWELLFALALGSAGSPSNVEGTAYAHSITPADSIADLFATLAIKKATGITNSVWEVPSAVITGFTITGEVGTLCKVSFDIMGNKLETASAVNTTATLANVTYPDTGNIVRINENAKFRMNAQAGAALQDSDVVYPFSFELSYKRPFKDNFEAGYSDASQPVQDGFAEALLKLSFDKYAQDSFMNAITNEASQKMDITFLGSTLSGSTAYQFRVDIPKITWYSGSADVGSPGVIPHPVEGRMLAVDSAPTGMSGVVDPIRLYIVNALATDPLA